MKPRRSIIRLGILCSALWLARPGFAQEPIQSCHLGANVHCDEGEFCETPVGSCQASSIGTCQDTPQTCDHRYEPVCGCDGKTYPNRCIASLFGVSLRKRGECTQGSYEASHAAACTLADDGWRTLQGAQAYPTPVPEGELWFCFGWDDSAHQCLLYAATEEICARLEPCWLPLARAPAGNH